MEATRELIDHLRLSPAIVGAFFAPLGAVLSVSEIDGLRGALADRSVIHLRPSGKAPEMHCNVKAEYEASASALLENGLCLV